MKAWGNRCLPKATQNVRVPARHRPEHVCPPAKWTEGDTDAPRPAPNSGPGAEPGQDPGSQGLASGQVAWDPPVSSQVTDGDSHTADDRAREPTALLVQRSCPGPVQTSSPFLSPRALPSPPLSSSPLLSSPLPSCPPLHSPPFPSSSELVANVPKQRCGQLILQTQGRGGCRSWHPPLYLVPRRVGTQEAEGAEAAEMCWGPFQRGEGSWVPHRLKRP